MTYNKLLKIGISIILIFSINACFASQNNSEESLYIKLEKEIMCPVCDGQTLDQSQSLIADDMKNTIKKKIKSGWCRKSFLIYTYKYPVTPLGTITMSL